ncbi:MAG: hypothetical protein Q4D33_13150 [Prevotellaceae bacterium]|nr:hypothetical protein [Prevotellaceae bacterium]
MNQLFRSAWEANVARLLSAKGIVWTYEKALLQLNGINYLPDFTLENSVILEVKGRWDADSLKKVLAFHKECPQYKLLIIDADLYFDLDKQSG